MRFALGELPARSVDVLIVGSGIAGLTVATSLDGSMSVALMTKGSLGFGSTLYAQGGVAAAVAEDDNPQLHFADTLVAAAGLGDEAAIRVLVEEAPDAVAFLEGAGVQLDLEGLSLAVTREGGHSRRRVVHSGGDATGAEIVRALLEKVRTMGIGLIEESFLVDIATDENGRVAGAVVMTRGTLGFIRCSTIVIASGGYGQLYAETTAPVSCTGDGTAAALRAGARLTDIEFVQFHPTTLFVASDPRPLLSEAMRGEGARLVDAAGKSVMDGVHPLGDLAPRDIVARGLFAAMTKSHVDHLYLDATGLGAAHLEHRFPSILAACRAHGIDPVTEPIPISPACHYTMGGIWTDLVGQTNLPGLYAVGEVASSGVHGANRLASNSLLEGAVFGRRAAVAINGAQHQPRSRARQEPEHSVGLSRALSPATWEDRAQLRRQMVSDAGVVRTGSNLSELQLWIAEKREEIGVPHSEAQLECGNLFLLAAALADAAVAREESRGAHFRSDFPETEDSWRVRQSLSRTDDGVLERSLSEVAATIAS
jgi:L-aspartate oxidase